MFRALALRQSKGESYRTIVIEGKSLYRTVVVYYDCMYTVFPLVCIHSSLGLLYRKLHALVVL